MDENETLDTRTIPYHYVQIVKRVNELKAEKEFSGSVDLEKESFIIRRATFQYQKAYNQWMLDNRPDSPDSN